MRFSSMNYFLFFLFSVSALVSRAQFNFQEREAELASLLDSVRTQNKDTEKKKWNNEFKKVLVSTLDEPTIFNQQFTKLKTLGVIDSPDQMVRIVNWNIELEDGTQQYTAFVLHKDLKKDKHKVFELIDNSMMLPGKPEETLEHTMWYGALYYHIIPVTKNGKTYYTVLGWDGGTRRSNTKLIDVIYFTGNSLKLGFPLFKTPKGTAKRMFYEHSERSYMSLKYEEEYKRIIFDHLMPENPHMEGIYEYYIPDMSYDAFVLEDGKWILHEDVIGVNKKQNTVSLHTIDSKTGEISSKEVESKWVDPTGERGPGSSDSHVAVLPGMETKNTTESNKTSAKPKSKKDMTALELYESKKRHRKEKEVGASFHNKKGKKKRK